MLPPTTHAYKGFNSYLEFNDSYLQNSALSPSSNPNLYMNVDQASTKLAQLHISSSYQQQDLNNDPQNHLPNHGYFHNSHTVDSINNEMSSQSSFHLASTNIGYSTQALATPTVIPAAPSKSTPILQPRLSQAPSGTIYSNVYRPSMLDSPLNGQLLQKKINPDMMPNVIEVIENDRRKYGGTIFHTGTRSICPPLVTSDFVCRDEGNCNPKFIRSSLYSVPNTPDLLKTCGIPFTITCCPFAKLHPSDPQVILSNMGSLGPIRCNRCKAYMGPMMTFVDGGRKFNCPLCGSITEVPAEYFAHIDHTGRRSDSFSRPELCLGSYELTATIQYCRNEKPAKPPAYIFLIDVSKAAQKSGLLDLFCSRFISDILPSLPLDDQVMIQYQYQARIYEQTMQGNQPVMPRSSIEVGFITYDKHLHFYSFKKLTSGQYSQPKMHVIADTNSMFVPGVEGFLISQDNVKAIQNLLKMIPEQFQDSNQPDPLLAPVIQAGMEALKATERPGKLFVIHSNLPSVEAPGRLKNREDRNFIGTEKEKSLINPLNEFYTTLGQSCVSVGCSVDLFLTPSTYTDLATIAEVPRLTGGRVFRYPCFLADMQGEDLICDLRNAVSRPKAFDCVIRVRTSTGTRPIDFFAHGNAPNATDVECSAMDNDWSLTLDICHDDKLPDGDVVFLQAVVLYTSLSGQRRLRVHNLSLATTDKHSEVFRMADLDTHINFLAKLYGRSILTRSSQQIVEDLNTKLAHLLASYRKHCSANSGSSAGSGELILPETMKLLPLFSQCLIKSDIIRSGPCAAFNNYLDAVVSGYQQATEISIDDRSMLLFLVRGMNVLQTTAYLYPRLFPVHNLNMKSYEIPIAIRCSYDRIQPTGAYILENGVNMFLWIGASIDQDWLKAIFGVPLIQQIPEGIHIIERDNEISKRLFEIISQFRMQHSRYCKLITIRQGDRGEAWLKHFMMEDQADNCPSYVEYLCHIHREVRALLK